MDKLDAKTLKAMVETAQRQYMDIQHREWNGKAYDMPESEMWKEASKVGAESWWEVIRVLAQGGDYYGIKWP